MTTILQTDGEGFPFKGRHAGLVAVDIAVTEQRVPGLVRWSDQRVVQGVKPQSLEGSSLGREPVGEGVGGLGLDPGRGAAARARGRVRNNGEACEGRLRSLSTGRGDCEGGGDFGGEKSELGCGPDTAGGEGGRRLSATGAPRSVDPRRSTVGDSGSWNSAGCMLQATNSGGWAEAIGRCERGNRRA